MHPILFKLGPFTIYSYGLMIALAFIAATTLASRAAPSVGIPGEKISSLSLVILFSGIIGARLFYILLDIKYFLKNPAEIIMVNHGGLVFYGGAIFAVISALAYAKMSRLAILDVADLLAPFIALGHSIGRIGCFLNGCCFGKPASADFGIVLGDGVCRYPTQIYSSLGLLALFIFLRILFDRRAFKGQVFFTYLMFYPAVRFLIEFLRGDNMLFVMGLTFSQAVSVIIFVVGITGYFLVKKWTRIK